VRASDENDTGFEEHEFTPRRGVEPSYLASDNSTDDPDTPVEPMRLNAQSKDPPGSDIKEPLPADTARQGSLFPEDAGIPPSPDPRTGNLHEIMKSLICIVSEFGPMPCHYAYELYRRSCGAGRLSRPMRSVLNRAMYAAVRKGDIVEENEYGSQDQINRIVRRAGTPKVRLRPRADRKFDQIAPSEIAAAMYELTKQENAIGRLSEAYLFRKVLEYYELIRLTGRANSILKVAYDIYRKSISEPNSQS
jgi:hypothetical protein